MKKSHKIIKFLFEKNVDMIFYINENFLLFEHVCLFVILNNFRIFLKYETDANKKNDNFFEKKLKQKNSVAT